MLAYEENNSVANTQRKKTLYGNIYAALRTYRSIAVTRSQFLRRLLRDHAQTAAVWKAIPA